ncbi:LLM class flavin-dependent oxidoreductase [Novosphingobium sp. ERN07]|uniref:LLM class flavin-dependent oxidoreductase n=1 Tax=Novosphingobium sp. ERN07 TaxID=2726187 RepID=UPI001457652E|nr:LLM class flavin-dependent oxidoreductase [Novosphingobium sp. ERN07]NLR70375.1 LLM class flavin-dependent oxidoreductase [Novosphingobium sp. ERN07]
MSKQIHLWAFLQGIGFFPTGWRHPRARPEGVFSMEYYARVAKMAEDACFDAIVFGDQLQSRGAGGRTPGRLAMPTLDPVSLLMAMAAVTERVGLVATVSTTYNTPEMLAERFAAMDRISGGRAGWNIVTTAHPDTAPNFGEAELPPKDQRYRNAVDVVAKACELWAAMDRAGPALPQGRPVLVQAGQSPEGRDFAARTAEAIFCPAANIEAGIDFRNDMRHRIAGVGGNPDGVRVMPGLSCVLGGTEEEARTNHAAILDMGDVPLAIEYLSESLCCDLTAYDPDAAIPVDDILAKTLLPPADVAKSVRPAAEKGTPLGDFAANFMRHPRGHNVFIGTGEQMAEMMIEWRDSGACDGFTLQPSYMPGGLEDFAEQVVPVLQKRGRLRTEYPGTTLRETLGLPARLKVEA